MKIEQFVDEFERLCSEQASRLIECEDWKWAPGIYVEHYGRIGSVTKIDDDHLLVFEKGEHKASATRFAADSRCRPDLTDSQTWTIVLRQSGVLK